MPCATDGLLPIDYSDPELFVARRNTTLCNTTDLLFSNAYVTSNLFVSNPLSVPVVLRTLDGAATWEGEPPSGAFPAGCSTMGLSGQPYGPMLTTPTLTMQYNFTLPPMASSELFEADLCLGHFEITNAILTCYAGVLDHAGQEPFLLHLALTGKATGSVGNFSIWPSTPLTINQQHLPLVSRVHCQNSSRC